MTALHRAYSVLDLKQVDDEKRIITGMATTPTPDRMGDIIEPLGVKFANPLSFLWQHRHDSPVGTVAFDKPTKAGVKFEGQIVNVPEPGRLKDRIDEAWQSVKYGLVRAVSIGFRGLEYSFMEGGGIRWSEIEVIELSLVTIPANAEATITAIKSFDAPLLAAAGMAPASLPLPNTEKAAPGKTSRVVRLTPARDRADPFVIRSIKRTHK